MQGTEEKGPVQFGAPVELVQVREGVFEFLQTRPTLNVEVQEAVKSVQEV